VWEVDYESGHVLTDCCFGQVFTSRTSGVRLELVGQEIFDVPADLVYEGGDGPRFLTKWDGSAWASSRVDNYGQGLAPGAQQADGLRPVTGNDGVSLA
jgi:hypothetical protein